MHRKIPRNPTITKYAAPRPVLFPATSKMSHLLHSTARPPTVGRVLLSFGTSIGRSGSGSRPVAFCCCRSLVIDLESPAPISEESHKEVVPSIKLPQEGGGEWRVVCAHSLDGNVHKQLFIRLPCEGLTGGWIAVSRHILWGQGGSGHQ